MSAVSSESGSEPGSSSESEFTSPELIRPVPLRLPQATAQQRGRRRGEELSELIRRAVDGYTEFFDARGISRQKQASSSAASLEALRDWDPLQHTEVLAVAQAARVTPQELGLVVARTEVLAAAGAAESECSTLVGVTQTGSGVGAQTWDWQVALAHLWHLHEVEPGEGTLGHVGFAEAGMLGKIGMNASGVGVMLNILANDGDRSGGVPVHAVLAAVLNRATSLDEAREIVRSASTSASSTITIVAPDGACITEIGPHGTVELPVSGVAAHTNHFVADGLQDGARELSAETRSHERLELLQQRIDGMWAAGAADELAALLCTSASEAPVSLLPDLQKPRWERPATLVSVRMDASTRSIEIAAGSPSRVSAEDWVTLTA